MILFFYIDIFFSLQETNIIFIIFNPEAEIENRLHGCMTAIVIASSVTVTCIFLFSPYFCYMYYSYFKNGEIDI